MSESERNKLRNELDISPVDTLHRFFRLGNGRGLGSQAIQWCKTTPKRQEMVVERKINICLSKGVGAKPLVNKRGSGRLGEVRQGSLGRPVCRLPLEKLKSTPHLFLEEVDFFAPTLASGAGFRPFESIRYRVLLEQTNVRVPNKPSLYPIASSGPTGTPLQIHDNT